MDRLARVGLRAPDGPYETLAGLVASELGRIPAVGDTFQVADWRLEVPDATGRRAARVLLHAPPEGEHPTGPATDGTTRARTDGTAHGEGARR